MRRRRNPVKTVAAIVLVLALIAGAVIAGRHIYIEHREREAAAAAAAREAKRQIADGGVGRGAGIELASAHVLLYDLQDDRLLLARGENTPCAPASLTKIMTVYTALQCIDDLDTVVTVTYEDLAGLYEENASVAGLLQGDSVSVRDLLYATMLPSGADAANALARAACGSVTDFVGRMNELSQSLGMGSTHWTNVTGLDEDGHVTTAADLLRLLKAALEDREFCEVFCTFSYTTAPTIAYPDGIALESTLTKKCRDMGIDCGPIIGAKTGYTDNAGLCLASLAETGGRRYCCVTLGAAGDSHSEQTNILDHLRLYSHCG